MENYGELRFMGRIGRPAFLIGSGDTGLISKVTIGFQGTDHDMLEGGSINIPAGVEFYLKVYGHVHVDTIGLDGFGAFGVTIKGNGPLLNNPNCYAKGSTALWQHDVDVDKTFGPWVMPAATVTITRIRLWTSGQKSVADIPPSEW